MSNYAVVEETQAIKGEYIKMHPPKKRIWMTINCNKIIWMLNVITFISMWS